MIGQIIIDFIINSYKFFVVAYFGLQAILILMMNLGYEFPKFKNEPDEEDDMLSPGEEPDMKPILIKLASGFIPIIHIWTTVLALAVITKSLQMNKNK